MFIRLVRSTRVTMAEAFLAPMMLGTKISFHGAIAGPTPVATYLSRHR
jgi:hypothetical protein